ncbi:RCC1 domain-containing protein [Candidatus Poriferisocius sp.]|uniref:RCC1 domain-containing protein n=1 Tax=Candidatus Poriferisocius sp. TaxID=3101276 RepID=UPI003B012033
MKQSVAFFLVFVVLATTISISGSATAQQAISQQKIQERDQLIANQENLLNTYRCLFGVDVHAVPGGCEHRDIVVVGAAPQNPTQGDLDVRDGLIQNQEALLNVYRCQFDVDTQLVPGGCSEGAPVATPDAGPVATPVADPLTIPEGTRGDDTLISVGRGRTCAVLIDGGATCWGRNGSLDHVVLAGIKDVAAITTSNHQGSNLHACILHEDRTISCWGSGDYGKLGQGDKSDHHLPVKVPRISDAVAVSTGSEYTCALHGDGGVSCWGRNDWGQMVDGTKENRLSPRRIPGLSDVVAIGAGPQTSCAVHRDGDISCWGRGYDISDSGPERFKPRAPFASVSVGNAIGAAFSCATSIGGDVYCWNPGRRPSAATRVPGLTDVVEVSVGYASACALHRDGGVSCWGTNQAGEVGDGTTNPRPRPKRVAGISDAVAVNVSFGSFLGGSYLSVTPHACALRADGSALCWGGNEVRQLGDGTNQNRLIPTLVRPIVPIPADQVPITPTERLRAWAELVVREHEANHPWMRVAWDHISERTLATRSGDGGYVVTTCYASANGVGCRADDMRIERFTLTVLVHELLHVYDLHTGLAPSKAWGAVQLYFATTYPDCHDRGGKGGVEILADTVTHLIVPGALLTYYLRGGCPSLLGRSSPTAEAEQVVLQGLAGQVPDWYRENITNGAELWAAWLRGPSIVALANLADEFGGLCNTDWIRFPFDPEIFPPAGSNPFKDGGCP